MTYFDDEATRLLKLQALKVLDTAAEPVFDAIARAASLTCDTPISLVCLVDCNRQWFKANIGLENTTQTPREISFCTHVIEQPGVMSVPDASLDPRFEDNELVTSEPRIRAYAGAPIVLESGHAVGTVCVIDRQPRTFTQHQLNVLRELAAAAASALEMRASAIAVAQAKQEALERELRLAQRLASVAHHSDDAIVGKSLDSIVTSWNLAAERIFGFTAAEIVGQPITVLFPKERLEEESFLLARIREGKSVPQFETVRLRKDGSEVNVSVSLSPIRDSNGGIVAISKVARDITERMNQERLLRESEARYRALVEDQTDLLSLSLPTGELKFANPAFATFFGEAVSAISGTNLLRRVAPSHRGAVREDLVRAASSQESITAENLWVDSTEASRWLSWTHRALRNERGAVFAIHSVGRDITTRRMAEEALHENEARLRKLYEATPAMMYSCDASGLLLTVSDVWLKKLGHQRDDVIGRNLSQFFVAESKGRLTCILRDVLRNEAGVEDVEARMLHSDGTCLDVRLSVIIERDGNGGVSHFLGVVQDVTAQRQAEMSLESHRERLAVAVASNDVGIWEIDMASGALTWSDRMFSLFDCDKDSFGGTYYDWSKCVHPDDFVQAEAHLRRALTDCTSFSTDFRVKHRNGEVHYLHARGTVATDKEGRALRVVGVNYDVTERTLIERQLAEKNELLRVTLESIGDAVITTDAQGRAEWLNPVAERMTGWLASEVRGRPLNQVFNILNQGTREPAESPIVRCLAEGRTVALADNTVLVSRNGVEFGIQDSASPIRSSDGEILGAILVFHDVSEQRRLGQEMTYRAKHDELTGLLNRAEFELRLSSLIRDAADRPATHSLLYIDLDQFKLVNDACGHSAGDMLLKQLASLFQSVIRSRDTLARLGGDEFGVLLEHCSVEQATRVAEKICAHMEEFRFLHDGRRFRLGTSIGLVPVDARWTSTAAPLQAADSASYAAKEAGRNRVHIWFDTDQAVNARMGQTQWGSRLENALHDGRFELFGQRIEPLSDAACAGGSHVEVLLRMRDDDGSLIAPGAFLPAAERFHMATRIDKWVVREVFTWLASEPANHTVDVFAINLSGQSIGDREFHRYVSTLLESSKVDPRQLCFEITETSAITNLADATAFIDAMRALGVRIALDDFGAGASSFGYLKSLAVDYLKIDGQFVRDLIDDPLDLAAVRCFTEVAKVVGVKTIAEYVERDELLEPLRSIGVDYVQGYTVHRPQPLRDAVAAVLSLAGATA